MNLYLLIFSTFSLVVVVFLVVYLTQLPVYRLNSFGNFLKKVLGILPITKVAEAILAIRKPSKEKIGET